MYIWEEIYLYMDWTISSDYARCKIYNKHYEGLNYPLRRIEFNHGHMMISVLYVSARTLTFHGVQFPFLHDDARKVVRNKYKLNVMHLYHRHQPIVM